MHPEFQNISQLCDIDFVHKSSAVLTIAVQLEGETGRVPKWGPTGLISPFVTFHQVLQPLCRHFQYCTNISELSINVSTKGFVTKHLHFIVVMANNLELSACIGAVDIQAVNN